MNVIREARLAAGLTQSALAKRAGLTAHSIYRYEAGIRLPNKAVVQWLLHCCTEQKEIPP